MLINQQTKISALLKQHPEALDALVSLSPKFEKLRNPFLRKLMAGRVSIGMAAKVGGCSEEEFFGVLKPLGFVRELKGPAKEKAPEQKPAFLKSVKPEQVVSLDVRPVLDAGKDPLKQILATAKALKQHEVLKIINTFEPTPLINMLNKKGFRSFTDSINPQHIETWFFRDTEEEVADIPEQENTYTEGDWGQLMKRFAGKLTETDVRELEMPQPMMKILEALDRLPQENALYVYHKRMPVFLLLELAQRGFEHRSRPVSENELHLLIFRS